MLKELAGSDGSEPYDDAGHSPGAMKTMQRFLIGSLGGYTSTDDRVDGHAALGDRAAYTNGSSRLSTSTLSLSIRIRLLALLVVAILGVLLARLYKDLGGNRKGDGDIELELGQGTNAAQAFWGGLLIASSLSCAGLGILYSQFSKTLKYENEVFSYPPVIPRRVGR